MDTNDEIEDEAALAELLKAGICFISGSDYLSPWANESGATTAVLVNCNDLFYWACADAEPLPRGEISNLYMAWRSDRKWGSSRWCCIHRNLQPQKPIVRDMKKEGFWDTMLESLPEPEPS